MFKIIIVIVIILMMMMTFKDQFLLPYTCNIRVLFLNKVFLFIIIINIIIIIIIINLVLYFRVCSLVIDLNTSKCSGISPFIATTIVNRMNWLWSPANIKGANKRYTLHELRNEHVSIG